MFFKKLTSILNNIFQKLAEKTKQNKKTPLTLFILFYFASFTLRAKPNNDSSTKKTKATYRTTSLINMDKKYSTKYWKIQVSNI